MTRPPATVSPATHPGRFKAHHANRYTDHVWEPDLVAIARRLTGLSRLPNAAGVLVLDFTATHTEAA